MSGQAIGSVIGQVIGYAVGGPIGGAIGGAIGGGIGSSFDTLPTQYGPRLDDLRAQRSEYGSPIPIIYGTVALQGNVIWAQEIKEVQTETEQGGKGGPSQTTVNYSYYGNFAVAICEGPIGGVLRIWAGPEKRLIYDGVALEGGNVRVYLGTEDQMPDPLIESDKGVGLAPAYRGTAYVVLEDYPLAKDGNRLPYLTFEVTTGDDGGTCGTDYTLVGTAPNQGRLYDVPPEKLGSFEAGSSVSSGEHPTAVDNDGNVYVLYSLTGGIWKVKKVSTTSPGVEAMLDLGGAFNSSSACSMAYDPNANIIGIVQEASTNYAVINCDDFSLSVMTVPLRKRDIIYSTAEQRLRMLDWQTEYVGGKLSPDCYGVAGFRFDGKLVDCGVHGIAVASDALSHTYLNGSAIANKVLDIYDPVRDRLIGALGFAEKWTGYYDFATGTLVTPTDMGPRFKIAPTYFPTIDRIISSDADGLMVADPSLFTRDAFPDECKLFGGLLLYADGVTPVGEAGNSFIPVPLPNARNKIVVVPTGGFSFGDSTHDIFTFALGVRGKGVSLASVVADLSDRSGESRYDVSQLEADTVDGYIIARQTQVRAAIDTLRPAYYFDAVESQGIIKYVKRGGNAVAVIDDADLAAHDAGGEAGDPLKTVRKMEVELPRAVNVKYMLAADDYNQAAKQARRLIGSSGDEQTVDVPLVLTDTKAQEVAEVNLHASWAERLSYEFSLPRKYSHLEPTDLIVVKGHLMRLTKVTATPRGVLQCEAVADESTYYAPHVVVTETQPKDTGVSQPGVTLMELF